MKSKFSNCDICPLKEQKMVIGETNCKDNIKNVELLILAEAPASEEVEQERPLVGPAGKIFREPFEEYGINKIPHFITNVVLCSNLQKDPKTGRLKTDNPPKEAIECCRPNWMHLVDILEPKLVFIMGGIPKDLFLIEEQITKGRGKIYQYKPPTTLSSPPKVLLTIHPSFVKRSGGLKTIRGKDFKSDMKMILEILRPNQFEEISNSNSKQSFQKQVLKLKEPYFFDLPDWMKSEEHSLIDIQKLPNRNDVVFSFRNKTGEKIFHSIQVNDTYYYMGNGNSGDGPFLEHVENLEFVKGPSPQDNLKIPVYESDVKVETKFSIDYYLQRTKEEPVVPLKVQFFDIEVYSGGHRAFPDPKLAKVPINAISFKYDDGPINVYVVDPRKLVNPWKEEYLKDIDIDNIKSDKWNVRIFDSEKELITEYIRNTAREKPDIITGWNAIGFDVIFIYNRMKKWGINPNEWSPLKFTHINPNKYGEIVIAGIYALDLLQLYKDFNQSIKSTYKLGAIANDELGEGKVEFEGSLDILYEQNFQKFIDYSGQDTSLICDIAKKKGHIPLRNELRRICCSTWKGAESSTGLIDPLVISYAKRRGLVCKNANVKDGSTKFIGAYVRNPIKGLHSWVIDLDFASLYPSIIISCNIGPDTYIGKIEPEVAIKYIYHNKYLPDVINVKFDPMKESSPVVKYRSEEFRKWLDDNQAIVTSLGTIFKGPNLKLSFFNLVFSTLLNARSEYKNKMKVAKGEGKDELYNLYYNIQWAYKILANSIYGVLGNAAFRMFKLDLAKSVTVTGQEVTKFAGHHLSRYMDKGFMDIDPNFQEAYDNTKPYLIYQDTDSVFLSIGEYLTSQGKMNPDGSISQ